MNCKHILKTGLYRNEHYCKLIPMKHDEDYPHKYLRVFCAGEQEKGFFRCKATLKGLIQKHHNKPIQPT